jgi:hypothetical protein
LSVGALLTQPQRLPRLANATPADAGLGDVAKLGIGVAIDTLKGGHVLEAFEAAGEAASARFVTQAENGFDHARERLAAMIEAPLAAVTAKAQELGSVDGPDAALAAAHDILTTVVALAGELTIDHIRQHLGELLDIIETDLGLTPDFLETELWALFDDMIDRLEHIAPESDPSLRSNRLQVIASLRSIKRAAEHEFHFPRIPLEQTAEALFDLIRRSGITSEAARVACVGANLVQVADAGHDLLHAVPFTGLGTGSIGAGTVPAPASTDVYLWYPSWLANNHRPFQIELALVLPGDDVVKTAAGQIVQRNTWRSDTLISESSSDWSQVRKTDDSTTIPYSFGSISAESMETVAWISSIVANGFELLFHLISLEEGDYASNIVNGVGAAGYGTWKAVKREPAPWWLEGLIFRFAGTFGASFEKVHTKAAFWLCVKEWLTLAGPDYAEMLSYKYFTETARDLLLSILTLANHKPGENGVAHPRNREEIDAIRNIIVMGLQNAVLAISFDRKEWGLLKPGNDYSPMLAYFLEWGLLVGTLIGLVGGTLGCLLGEAISGDFSGSPTLNKLWYGIPQGVLLNPYWLYLQQEGHTSGGTFNPAGPSDFLGYPKPASASPYKLPYDSAAVGSCYVGQANEGLFSHNFNNVDQIYAYDFSLDKNDEILAARPGTVVAFFEGVPDDQTGGAWNYIAIQHDVDDSGAKIGSDPQDQGPGGGLIKTVAVYGHGRNGSVSAAFARHVPPVPTGSILNSQVKQGMPIMDAGCTGISFHNHLHMHVVPAPLGGGGTGNTIPFVFSDADTGGSGNPTHFNFYTSANVRRLS